jgi:hypothetical protein
MSRMTPGVDPSLMAQITQLAQIGTQQRGQDIQRQEAGARRQMERERISASEEQSALDRKLARESEIMGLVAADTRQKQQMSFQQQQAEEDRKFRAEQQEMVFNREDALAKREVQARLDSLDFDTSDEDRLLEEEREGLLELQISQAEAEALRSGKEEEFNEAKAKLVQQYRDRAEVSSAFEERLDAGLDTVTSGVVTDINTLAIPEGTTDEALLGFLGAPFGNVGTWVANKIGINEEGKALGLAGARKEEADELFQSGSVVDQGVIDSTIGDALGDSLAVAFDKEEIKGELSDIINLQMAASRRGEDVSEVVRQRLDDLEIDESLFYSGLRQSHKKFSKLSRMIDSQIGEEVGSDEVSNYIFSQAFRTSAFTSVVQGIPEVQGSSFYRSVSDRFSAVRSPAGASTILPDLSEEEASTLQGVIDELQQSEEAIPEILEDIIRAQAGLERTERTTDQSKGEKERQAQIKALRNLLGSM